MECQKICDNPVGCSNIAYPKLVLELLPYGVRGLLMAVMLSANMSSLTSIFNSASTIFTMDLWRRMRPTAREKELMAVGRIFIVALCVVSILWIPLLRSSQGGQLFAYINAVQSYLGTPIGALFLLAITWKRMSEQGAFWGIVIGHLCGVIRLALDMAYPAPECGHEDTRPSILVNLHYTYFGALMIVITSLAIVVISLLTKPPTEEMIGSLVWKNRITGNSDYEENEDEMVISVNMKNTFETTEASNGDLSEDSNPSADRMSMWRHWVKEICGVSSESDQRGDLVFDDRSTKSFMKEDPRLSNVLSGIFVVGMVTTGFLYGMFH